MNEIINMHMIVRKYCIEKIDNFSEELMKNYKRIFEIIEEIGQKEFNESKDEGIINLIQNTKYNTCLKNIFKSFLIKVESMIANDYKLLEEFEVSLINVIESSNVKSHVIYCLPNYNEEEKRLSIISKQELISYIKSIDKKKLNYVEPIFYRRVLAENEIDYIEEKVRDKWGIENFADPFTGSHREDVIVFKEKFFYDNINFLKLQSALKNLGEEKIYEINITDPASYIMEISAFAIFKQDGETCLEGFWCSTKMEWIIYKSHENTISIGGKILIDEVKILIDSWEDGIFIY